MCGVVGAINVPNAYNAIVSMQDALQYRGENGAGIALATYDGDFFWERTEFTVPDLVRKTSHRGFAKNNQSYFSGIGHDRYGTAGDKRSLNNAQPLMAKMSWGDIFLAHNGDSPYMEEDRQALIQRGLAFSTTSDSELILHQIALAGSDNPLIAIKKGLRAYRGTYALTMLIRDKDGVKLVAARDLSGNRPLALGRLGGGYVVASEDSAFEVVNAVYERDILPGELLVISPDSLSSSKICDESGSVLPLRQCIYENIYFSIPSSFTFGIPVNEFRKELGRRLAKLFGHLIKPIDIITNVPDSSNAFAEGFCQAIHRELTTIMLRRHSTRSFTQENQAVIDDTLRRKFSFLRSVIEHILKQNPDTRFWIIEDSIVRGNTARKIARVLRGFGVRFIGILSGAPPLIGPCKKGIDMGGKDSNLIAAQHLLCGVVPDSRAVAAEIEANFVGYQPLQEIYDAVRSFGKNPNDFCYGCFENKEPIWGKW